MSETSQPPHPDDRASLADWFDQWGSYVTTCDFKQARGLFAPTVVSFGTFMDLVEGLDALEARQWRSIWPTISDFRFMTEDIHVWVSRDRCLATTMLMWNSTGYNAQGVSYPRPGRTTAVLSRSNTDARWLCDHTHFSEFPGKRQRSFGNPD